MDLETTLPKHFISYMSETIFNFHKFTMIKLTNKNQISCIKKRSWVPIAAEIQKQFKSGPQIYCIDIMLFKTYPLTLSYQHCWCVGMTF